MGTYLGFIHQLPDSLFAGSVPAATVASSQTADREQPAGQDSLNPSAALAVASLDAASTRGSQDTLDSTEAAAGSAEAPISNEKPATVERLKQAVPDGGALTCTACGIGASFLPWKNLYDWHGGLIHIKLLLQRLHLHTELF